MTQFACGHGNLAPFTGDVGMPSSVRILNQQYLFAHFLAYRLPDLFGMGTGKADRISSENARCKGNRLSAAVNHHLCSSRGSFAGTPPRRRQTP